jgi:hypothetical protein
MSLFPTQSFISQAGFLSQMRYRPMSYSDVDPDYGHLDSSAQAAAQDDDTGFFSDLFMGVASGVEGFGRSVIGLADFALGDALPDEWSERTLERPDSLVGGLVEGITQFGLGLIPGLGMAGLLGKGGKLLNVSDKLLKTSKTLTTGVTADFVAFDAHEERLSDFLASHDVTRNVVTEYLSSDEDDGEFEGRMKNVLEGGALAGVAGALIKGVKTLKKGRKLDGSEDALDEYTKSADELKEALIESGIATRQGIEIEMNLKNKLPSALRRVRDQLNNTKLDQQGGGRTEVDTDSALPKYPDC